MSGRNGWHAVSPGRPPKAPDLVRCPEGSWWLRPEYQQDRARFDAKVVEENHRMRVRGLSADPLNWKP